MNCNVFVKKWNTSIFFHFFFDVCARRSWRLYILFKSFKTMTNVATSSNLLTYFFDKNVLKQSIRFDLLNAWTKTYSNLIKLLTNVKKKCFALIRIYFLFLNKRWILMKIKKSRFSKIINTSRFAWRSLCINCILTIFSIFENSSIYRSCFTIFF